jgi:hypothetical protein
LKRQHFLTVEDLALGFSCTDVGAAGQANVRMT